MRPDVDLCVVGGAGHVGLPLAMVFADLGLRVDILDRDPKVLETVRSGRMPFLEKGGPALLRRVLRSGRLSMGADPAAVARARHVVLTIGTPIDEFLNPRLGDMTRALEPLLPHLRAGQTMILRSTVQPGTTEWLDRWLRARGKRLRVCFCPERIVQGQALEELSVLPQIVSGTTPAAVSAAKGLFRRLAPKVVTLEPREAEFAKLFCNAWRYIQFAVANQFFTLAHASGLDYYRIYAGMTEGYPRMRSLPRAGFAAGPCLFKDTMQLAASPEVPFSLGLAAVQVNERLPNFVVERAARGRDLSKAVVGLLGMAFKPDNDDRRSSLSYKVKKLFEARARSVLTTDPFVKNDPDLLPLARVLRESDLLVLCTPHSAYRGLRTGRTPVVDIWDFLGRGIGL